MEIYSGCENTFIICMYQSQKDHAAYAQMVCKNKIDGFMMVKTTPLEMVLSSSYYSRRREYGSHTKW